MVEEDPMIKRLVDTTFIASISAGHRRAPSRIGRLAGPVCLSELRLFVVGRRPQPAVEAAQTESEDEVLRQERRQHRLCQRRVDGR